ncbi:unnamed protein product [Durusdinium trenchii]|uniref:Uncharacterized protein n=1 Tax=Durusdinium trenchii TaxID=1381693 RepID=A0ABP0N5K8_9DINO
MKRCCPERLPERIGSAEDRRAARKAASEEDWISEEEVKQAALKSFASVKDPLHRRVLELRFGADQGGLRRSPAEVAEALGGKYHGKAETALMLIRQALRSIPLVADDPKDLVVVYEDEDLLAVSKPPFLRVTPVHRFVGKSLTNQVLGYLQATYGEEYDSPMVLHRLDQTTSGLVLCAKNKEAARICGERWHDEECKKEYLAIALPTASCQLSNATWSRSATCSACTVVAFAHRPARKSIACGVTSTRVELDLETLEVMDVFCEEDGPVRIHMKSPLDGSARQFDRPRDQQLQKTLQRMALTLKRGPKKKTKTKKAMLRTKEAQQDIQQVSSSERSSQSQSDNIASQVQLVEPDDCLYDNQGQPINDHLPLADAFTSARKPTCLMLGGRRYRIRLNRPLVKTITCGGQPMAGFRLVPVAHWDGEQSIRWEWRTSSGELLARTRCFTPTEADVGSRLEVVARPPLAEDEQMSRLLGVDDDQAAARLSFEAVAKAPPFPPGLAAEREEEMQRQKLSWQLQHDKSNFRVLSYNMLADAYRHCWDYIFPYCDPETLLPERRLQLCRQEVCTFNADIMALQEVDAFWYKDYWQPQFAVDGYGCCFTKKASGSGEGCLLAYKEKAFELLDLVELPLRERPRSGVVQVAARDEAVRLSSADLAVGALLGRLPALEDVFPRLGTVAQLALLKSKEPDGRLLLVCNTHLYFANFARHIRVLQVALILDEAESICKRAEFEFGQRPALLFLGDLNSEPDTGATALLQGSVSAAHPDWARCAPFRWGYASSRQAAKDMLTALRTKRPEAYSSLGDETEEDGLDGLRCSTERLQRVRNCLATLGIGEPQEAEEEAPEEQYDQVLGSSTDNSPWTSLEQKLQAGGTFKNCAAVATAQLAVDLQLSTEPVLEFTDEDLDAAKDAAEALAEVVGQKMQAAVKKQQAVAEMVLEESDVGPALAGLGLQLSSPFKLSSACQPDFTNFVGNYEACLDWIFFTEEHLEKVSEAPMPSREAVAAETALPSQRFPSDAKDDPVRRAVNPDGQSAATRFEATLAHTKASPTPREPADTTFFTAIGVLQAAGDGEESASHWMSRAAMGGSFKSWSQVLLQRQAEDLSRRAFWSRLQAELVEAILDASSPTAPTQPRSYSLGGAGVASSRAPQEAQISGCFLRPLS